MDHGVEIRIEGGLLAAALSTALATAFTRASTSGRRRRSRRRTASVGSVESGEIGDTPNIVPGTGDFPVSIGIDGLFAPADGSLLGFMLVFGRRQRLIIDFGIDPAEDW